MNQVIKSEDLVSAVPLEPEVKKMTRREKFLHWAELVRRSPHHRMGLHSNLEYYTPEQLRIMAIAPGRDWDVFSLAVSDPVFNAQGLKREGSSMLDIAIFFEASAKGDLHAFSCDCGGAISKETMVSRMKSIANPAAA